MMKTIWIILFLFVVNTASALEYQGQTITAQDIKNLPPGTIEALPQGNIDQIKEVKEAVASEAKETSELEEDDDIKKLRRWGSTRGAVIENQYRQGYSSTLSKGLRQFGYDIFGSGKIQPSSLAVPDEEYLIGTGDSLSIRLWGSGLDAGYSGTVDREGNINLPKIGIIHLAGVKYGEVESVIKQEAEKYIQGINLSVTLTKLRSLEIYVVGAVSNPGLHIIPAFSTIFDGLLSAGGIKKSGTLRKIKLTREDKLIKIFDIHDLLLKGSRGTDEILKNKDVIFVPGIGKTAAVAGAVNNQGIFELSGEKTVQDLVNMAGGVLPQAFGSRIYLRRFENNQNFVINDINSESIREWKKIDIQDGDLVEVTFSSAALPSVVRLEGHVWNPDVFNFKDGMKLSDILTAPILLKPDAILDFALIYRYDLNSTRITPMQFPLSKVFNGEYDVSLQPFDKIVILSRAKVGIKENFSISGGIWKPGTYEYKSALKLNDALALAGGLMPEARTDRIEIKRKVKTETKFETKYIELDLSKNPDFVLKPDDQIMIPKLKDYFVTLEGHIWYPEKMRFHSGMTLSEVLISRNLPKPEDLLKPNAVMEFGLIERYDAQTTRTTSIRFPLADVFNGTYDAELKPFDKIKILSRTEFDIVEKFSMAGAVWKKGDFTYQPGLRLKDALALAGGLRFGARKNNIELARQIIQDNQVITRYITLDYDKDGDTLLQPYDSIMVPMIKDATFARKVSISGEIAYPGTYTIRDGEKLSGLIQRAGGFTELAYFYGAKYTSQDARAIQQKSINQMIEQLQLSYIQTTSAQAQSALSSDDIKAAEVSGQQTQAFIAKLKEIKAEGRIAIHLADLVSFTNSEYDFTLKPGDALYIPEKPSFVSVIGSVYSPGSFLYQPNKKLKFYLAKSGGTAKTADEDYIYLLKANGEILSATQDDGFFSKFENTILMPGDTIVVPEDLERVPYLKTFKDVTEIVFRIAMSSGVVLAL